MIKILFDFSRQCKQLQLEKPSCIEFEIPIASIKDWQSIYSQGLGKFPGSDRVNAQQCFNISYHCYGIARHSSNISQHCSIISQHFSRIYHCFLAFLQHCRISRIQKFSFARHRRNNSNHLQGEEREGTDGSRGILFQNWLGEQILKILSPNMTFKLITSFPQ